MLLSFWIPQVTPSPNRLDSKASTESMEGSIWGEVKKATRFPEYTEIATITKIHQKPKINLPLSAVGETVAAVSK